MDAETGPFEKQTLLNYEGYICSVVFSVVFLTAPALFIIIIRHHFWRPSSTFAVRKKNAADDTRTSLQISSPVALSAQWLCFYCERTSGTTHTHTHALATQFILPSLFSALPPPSPRPNKCTYTYARAKCGRVCVRTSHPPSGDLKTDTMMTLHSNQSSFLASDPEGAAIVAAPCNIQSQTKGEINDLSERWCAGG